VDSANDVTVNGPESALC